MSKCNIALNKCKSDLTPKKTHPYTTVSAKPQLQRYLKLLVHLNTGDFLKVEESY